MPLGRVAAIGAMVAAVLWASLDSGVAGPPAPAVASAGLIVLAVLFGTGAWAMQVGGRPERAPLLAGLALACGTYALLRLTLPG